jgi:hypothetical protein
MAIDNKYLQLINGVDQLFKRRDNFKKLKVASLSYLDLIVGLTEVQKYFPNLNINNLQFRSDSKKICDWHGIIPEIPIIETSSFFKEIGFDVDFFDFDIVRGVEKVIDLNEPLKKEFIGQYDLVLDTGTLEHCFNVGVAFQNMCNFVKVNGIIITASPITKVNHGFWNFSPCVYDNFFTQNGWKVLHYQAFTNSQKGLSQITVSTNGRQVVPPESLQFVIAKRLSLSTVNFPIQKKYLKN